MENLSRDKQAPNKIKTQCLVVQSLHSEWPISVHLSSLVRKRYWIIEPKHHGSNGCHNWLWCQQKVTNRFLWCFYSNSRATWNWPKWSNHQRWNEKSMYITSSFLAGSISTSIHMKAIPCWRNKNHKNLYSSLFCLILWLGPFWKSHLEALGIRP